MSILKVAVLCLLTMSISPRWAMQTSRVATRLRGVSAVSEKVAWASGAGSTVLRTTDAGATWQKLNVTTDALDFRDIDAFDEETAYALSVGNGAASRIYKTTDGGKTWAMQFKSNDAKVFLDAMSFWDANHGVVFGDSVDGRHYILRTSDGGRVWSRVSTSSVPIALENEGAFAASGTNIALFGQLHAWIGTGAGAKARVLRSSDRGNTWQVSETPLAAGPSAGIFSIAFRDAKNGVVAGGDYKKEQEAIDNLAVTRDGGVTWKLVKGLSGFRSVVTYVPNTKTLIALGPAGGDYSTDDGLTWKPIEGPGFDTFSFVPRKSIGWASGANGSIGRLTFSD